ncbi:hypothetical protein [Nocardia salmonicida]|uniref:hypothetical protein n=1 Tax=Nocardia salmonicida TaxID=53431 RepID=UPI00362D371C
MGDSFRTYDSEQDATTGYSEDTATTTAGLLFFAFAGYARIETLGEVVRNPTRTIPRGPQPSSRNAASRTPLE